ncbi:glycosyltransferase family 2 protein [Flaviramulus sp. BrNp1-15]|uniref:glycosyltransferase n=1 Tax=Flaviramulus sp. BrNp1-15 TaxID=2916754 RepID=UPI001EE82A0D|nr:glycosyltransferase family 2 protein [Flaviramulus sp. BrNp1-15]ULC60562.1 glycosyltransferase family 2 protein [Flaviramulus sp. BrNp1-15]
MSCSDYNVIVIDNASQDKTVSFIKHNYPDVILLEQKINLGFGQANNLGISYALKNGADYVFLLNQDAYLQSNTIDELIKTHKQNVNYGILSPIQLNGLGNKLDRNFSNYLKYDNNNYFHFDAISNSLSEVYEVPFVNAAGWLLPKSTLTKIGGFDPIFFHYGEDDNYCQRLRYHGLKIGVVPHVFLKHDREYANKGINEKTMKYVEWFYKLKWADITNTNINHEIKNKILQLKKTRFKFFLKLNLSRIKYCNQELKLIYRIIKDIKKSRDINKKTGNHYI